MNRIAAVILRNILSLSIVAAGCKTSANQSAVKDLEIGQSSDHSLIFSTKGDGLIYRSKCYSHNSGQNCYEQPNFGLPWSQLERAVLRSDRVPNRYKTRYELNGFYDLIVGDQWRTIAAASEKRHVGYVMSQEFDRQPRQPRRSDNLTCGDYLNANTCNSVGKCSWNGDFCEYLE
jgi:hypothetical protein